MTFACSLLLTINSGKSSNDNRRIAAITMVKSHTPIAPVSPAYFINGSEKSWFSLPDGTFNLGQFRYGMIKIQPVQTVKKLSEEIVIAISKNNVFTNSHLYYQQDDKFVALHLTQAFDNKNFLQVTLPKKLSTKSLYLSLSGRYLRGEVHILTANEFTQYIRKTSVSNGIYVGVVALFLLLSLLSYIVLKKAIFFKYAVLLTAMFLWIAAGEGWLNSYIPETQSLPFFTANSLGLLFFIAFSYFSYDYLALNYLTSKNGKILKLSQRLLVIIWFGYCFSFNRFESALYQVFYAITLIICAVILVTAFISAINSLKQRNKLSLCYLAAMGVFVVCSITSGLSMTNIINVYLGWTFIKVSSLIEVSLLSSGLIYWYRDSMNTFVNEQIKHRAAQAELAATKQQLTDNEILLTEQQSNTVLRPQIAKIISLINNIMFVKAAGNYAEVIYRNGENVKSELLDINLQEIEQSAHLHKLTRCHKSYLINLKYDFKLTRRTSADYDLVLEALHVPVGRKYLKDIRILFN